MLTDFLIISILAILTQVLVDYYLPRNRFSRSLRLYVKTGAILWIAYSLVSETATEHVLGIRPADAFVHRYFTAKLLSYMQNDQWQKVWDYAGLGNRAYHLITAFTHFWIGGTNRIFIAANGFFAFWGGLNLVKHLDDGFSFGNDRNTLYLFVIFFPSVVFWATANLKEGLMYWAVCNIFVSVFSSRKGEIVLGPLTILSLIVGGVLRAHVMFAWVFSIATVLLLQRGRRILVLGLLCVLPILIYAFSIQTGIDYDPASYIEFAQEKWMILDKKGGGSHIVTGPQGPTFFGTGFISIFFRPFPWELRSLRFALTILETWTVTLLLVFTWLGMGSTERRMILRLPEIRVSILAVLIFCIMLSYLPNQGLIVRQRIQVVPALLTLIFRPRILRGGLRNSQRLMLAAQNNAGFPQR